MKEHSSNQKKTNSRANANQPFFQKQGQFFNRQIASFSPLPLFAQSSIIQKQDNPQKNEPSEKAKLGQKIIDKYSDGLNVMFYEIDDPDFKSEAENWAKTYDAVGFNGKGIGVENITFGVPIKERTSTGKKGAKKLTIAETLNSMGDLLTQCVKEANDYTNLKSMENHEILNPFPMQIKFKTLALASHGWDGGTSLDVDSANISDFLKSTSKYLSDDVNIIFYACTIAKNEDEDYDQWYKVYNEDGGENSLPAKARDELAELGHDKGEVWGHTAVGHFIRNYTLRRFQASDKGEKGESFLLYCFNDEIDQIVNAVIDKIKLDNENIEVSDTTRNEINTLVYKYTKEDFRACYARANSKVKMDVEVDGKTVERHLAEVAPLYPDKVKEKILNYRNTEWKKKFDQKEVEKKVFLKIEPKLKKDEK